ncbi:MAG: hypothetical protein QNJ57_02735 [Flavobacteriaceae bacterium]|nr:hypothetical protein [Flavobacteriaceae bacterium]
MKTLLALLLTLVLISCGSDQRNKDHLGLSPKLSGSWKATAFSGELHETWTLGNDGWMQQQGYYIEQSDTSYSAKTRIEKVGDAIILFSVIKNSNPKIFKASKVAENELIFENKDYKNPYRVHYEFIDEVRYTRTITGYENDSLVRYEFEFQKQID